MKINYDKEMEKIIDAIKKNKEKNEKSKLLIQSCCAPCSAAILEYLREFFEITIYFYNPNITFEEEYKLRLEEQKHYDKQLGYDMTIIGGEYNPKKDFFQKVIGLEKEPEGGKRCYECYHLRMEATAIKAKELGFDYFTTALSISPMKNSQWINEIGKELEERHEVKFLFGDFKKRSRYLRSVQLTKEHNLYRQDYCGCVFSIRTNKDRSEETNE
ncbi:MAG: epoxyqueuosine reductase QueH [Cetobacterium sp.]